MRVDADRRRVEASAAGRYGATVLELLIERDRLSVRDGAEQLVAYDIDPPKQHDLARLALRLPASAADALLPSTSMS